MHDERAYVLAGTTAGTSSTIQEVLLETIANALPKFRTRATELTIAVVTSIGVVALGVTTHDCLALLIAGRTLSTGA
jgi:copper oxidase (laccase) domain-containing protein